MYWKSLLVVALFPTVTSSPSPCSSKIRSRVKTKLTLLIGQVEQTNEGTVNVGLLPLLHRIQ